MSLLSPSNSSPTASDRVDPFSTDLWWWVRPKRRSDIREKAKRRGTSVETEQIFRESPDISKYRAEYTYRYTSSFLRVRSDEIGQVRFVFDEIAYTGVLLYCMDIVLKFFSLFCCRCKKKSFDGYNEKVDNQTEKSQPLKQR